MKKIEILIIVFFCITTVKSQSALCLQFLPQKSIQTYCVDNYPLGNDDSINITFLMAADSQAYNTMLKFLYGLPNQRGTANIERLYKKDRNCNGNKCFVIRLSATLPGDNGRYLTFFSPYDMSAMIFHVRSDNDMEKVVAHVLTKEITN